MTYRDRTTGRFRAGNAPIHYALTPLGWYVVGIIAGCVVGCIGGLMLLHAWGY